MNPLLIVTVASVVAFPPAPLPKEKKLAPTNLEGVWEIERYELGTLTGIYLPEPLDPILVIRNGMWWKERDLLGEVVTTLKYAVQLNPA